MTLATGPNTGLLINGAPGEAHYAQLVAKWRWEDFLLQPVVKSRVTALPTTGQVEGDAYLFIGTGTNANKIARWWATGATTAQWEYLVPKSGWRVQISGELDAYGQVKTYEYSGTAWSEKSAGGISQADADVRYEPKRKDNLTATTNPSAADDQVQGYSVLSRWVNTTTGEMWLCLNASTGAANWQQATLSLDELGSAALANVGEGPTELPTNAAVATALQPLETMIWMGL
ncbi:Protein of unknown function [Pseudomonas citronellolis]|uniref:DUF2793 domain-containing protein n=1 Tax=Pseudomonas citronellolis TaxID=53408 RepID=A0AAQ1KJ24_9PSED|nr:DUF2793 domain-containing protein [Pseudomonas citronellolis]TGC32437.1 hypothetical protein CW310_02095 [Pseudomonas citronellolis]SFD52701.1 Protein of unknown function [Pseudomonas citronellolis]